MNRKLSPATLRQINALFPEPRRDEVAQLFIAECGADLSGFTTLGPADLERIQFAVLKLSGGSLDRLRGAVAQGRSDWRDSLIAAGFGDDVSAHAQWLAEL